MNENHALARIKDILEGTDGLTTQAERIAEVIRRAGGYRWVGIYEVTEDEIGILGWSGPGEPTYPRFPRSQGLCGAAVSSATTVVVEDVTADPRYLTTFRSTRSEIAFLEQCAATIISLWVG